MSKMKSINPYTCEIIKEYEELDSVELENKIQLAHKAFLNWRNTSFKERSVLMQKCADVLIQNKEQYGKIITLEMGKPISQAIAEVEKSSWVCKYYADNAEKILKDDEIESDASHSYIAYDPLGVVLAIMPWNFPFWQVFRFLAPAVMAGNVGLLKHASNVPHCSLLIEEILIEAGFTKGVFQSLLIGSSKISTVIEHPVIKAVTLTGSEKAGSEVAMTAGKNIKKTVLELGGSDSFVVLKDADIEAAVEVAVSSRLINNGQSCIAAKRFIVEEQVYDDFLIKFKNKLSQIVMGDPLTATVTMGPLARPDLVVELDKQVKDSVASGATLYYQLPNPLGKAFFGPAILTDVKPGMRAYEEELFGPVATIFKVKSEEDAIHLANDTKFGLGAAIWTKDAEKGRKLARRIEAGAVFINGLVKSDPRLPFGGVKASGYGRELSYLGIKEFMNQKTIWVK